MKSISLALAIVLAVFALNINTVYAGSGHSHDGKNHSHSPHAGIVKAFAGPKGLEGFIELKLHDDKGDLELWITSRKKNAHFDVPLNSVINVTFSELGNKTVDLKVRNTETNEDENGQGNVRDNKTNYFIFPGDSGNDASFLMGKEFSSEVVVSFVLEGVQYSTDPFVLTPHTH